jgi:hypothetical protein
MSIRSLLGVAAVHFRNFSELRTSAIRRLLPLPVQLGQFSVDARIIFSVRCYQNLHLGSQA